MSPQGRCWSRCTWLIWPKHRERTQCWNAVLNWLEAQKKTDLKTLLGEHASSKEGWLVWRNCQNFMIHQKAHYLCSIFKSKNEDLLLFMVTRVHRVTALNGCHWAAGHQGCDCTLSLLQEHFWWPGMTSQMQQSTGTCTCCLQHESSLHKAPLHPIVATASLDLLHVDFTSIETTLEPTQSPRVANVLVFQDHFMKHILAYVTPNQTAKTITKFLYQGYIFIFEPWQGSWVTEMLTSWVVWLTKCARSLAWRSCRPCPTTQRLMDWWTDCIRW